MAMSPEQALNPQQPVPVYKRHRVCCFVCTVVLISLAIVTIALSQTLFKFRDPNLSLNDVKLQNVSLSLDLPSLSTILSISASANLRVGNSNYYDFKYSESEVMILYHGDQVGVIELGNGTIRSRKTVDLPAVITVQAVKVLFNALQDIASNVVSFNINSVLEGRVNLAHVYKKHVTAILNCTMDVFISNQTLKQNDCKQTIKL